jgi:hypothetical protein
MQKYLLSAFLIISLLFVNPCMAADKKPFLAIFTNPGGEMDWYSQKPDLLFTGGSWRDYDTFIYLVKKLAKNREVVVDISCHGSKYDGRLWLDYDAFGYNFAYSSSVGHVLNKITENLPKCKKVIMEACYSEICMEESLITHAEFENEGNYEESYKFKTIPYPVYGVGNTPNFNNLVYLEDKYDVKPFFMDLRDTINDGKATKPDDSQNQLLANIWSMLYLYGQ